MSVTTPMTVVLKTVLVGSVKLSTPADRNGLGLTAVAAYPAEFLSRGRFPSPHNPEPENVGPRQEVSAMQMQTQQMHAKATAAAPAGRAGCPAPGFTARWRPWSFSDPSTVEGSVATKRAAAAGRLAGDRGLPAGETGRSRFPGLPARRVRVGRDCQSPDRTDDRSTRDARQSPTGLHRAGESAPAAAAGK